MSPSKIPIFIAIILIIIPTTGCISSKQPQFTSDKSIQPPTPIISIITSLENKSVNNDTYWIRIDPITGYKTHLNGFSITALNNLPVGETVIIEIRNESLWAEGYSGQSFTGNILVTNGNGKINKTSYRVNPDTLLGNGYVVRISAGERGPSNITNFMIWPVP
jgi:hypothetical protein